jgi:hypothetical protein
MKLYEEYESVSTSLLQSIDRCTKDALPSKAGNICAAFGSISSTEEFMTQRSKIQALTSKEIQAFLTNGWQTYYSGSHSAHNTVHRSILRDLGVHQRGA